MSHHNEKEIKKPEGGGEAQTLTPALYLVATPIGNLRDITLRALDTLKGADKIACEDTRVTGKLLGAYDISKPTLSYNDHSDEKKRGSILNEIEAGKSIALVSDAGSPLISDPGFKLVRDAIARGLKVTSIPGACAVIMGLQLSGLPSDSFSFIGFLPNKQKARKDHLQEWGAVQSTLVAYETGPRLLSSLSDIQDVYGDRRVCVARELTKMYEESKTDAVSSLIDYYENNGAPKGEIVLIIAGATDEIWDDDKVRIKLIEALKTMKTKDAANYVAEMSGRSKKDIYDMALSLPKGR